MKLLNLFSLFILAVLASAQAPNWTKQSPSTVPNAVGYPAMAFDSVHGQVLLLGGYLRFSATYYEYNGTWIWDGGNWTKKSPQTSPPPRDSQVMAYDPVRGQVVLFGGDDSNGFPLGDTWTWDGTTWTQQTTKVAPAPRMLATMVFDSARGQMVLFGGYDGNGKLLNDTWVWNGTAWSQKAPSASPPARSDAMMAYDSLHNQTVLFGGYSFTTLFNDTWVWDGTTWTMKTPKSAPSPRSDGVMAFDSAHGQAVLFGGQDSFHVYPETWVWDGTTWTQQSPAASPQAVVGMAMAYDAIRKQIVLFGGLDAANYYNDTWTWPAPAAQPTGPMITNVISASAFGGFSTVAPGSWVELYGSNLAPDSRSWTGADFSGNNAPTSLDGVQVTIGGQKAAVAYIASTQVNAQLPSNILMGTQQITVANGNATSPAVNVTVSAMQPGLLAPASFNVGGKQFVVALLPDNVTYILPTGAIAGVNSRPAHSGETVVLYGVGFGSVMPATPAGEIATEATQLASDFQVMFGGAPAQITYAGLAPGFVGLYQINVVVPPLNLVSPVGGGANVVTVTFTLAGVPGTQTLYTAVQQ